MQKLVEREQDAGREVFAAVVAPRRSKMESKNNTAEAADCTQQLKRVEEEGWCNRKERREGRLGLDSALREEELFRMRKTEQKKLMECYKRAHLLVAAAAAERKSHLQPGFEAKKRMEKAKPVAVFAIVSEMMQSTAGKREAEAVLGNKKMVVEAAADKVENKMEPDFAAAWRIAQVRSKSRSC